MKIKLIKKSIALPNCWKSCGVDKDAWDKLQDGKEIEVFGRNEVVDVSEGKAVKMTRTGRASYKRKYN